MKVFAMVVLLYVYIYAICIRSSEIIVQSQYIVPFYFNRFQAWTLVLQDINVEMDDANLIMVKYNMYIVY